MEHDPSLITMMMMMMMMIMMMMKTMIMKTMTTMIMTIMIMMFFCLSCHKPRLLCQQSATSGRLEERCV